LASIAYNTRHRARFHPAGRTWWRSRPQLNSKFQAI